MLVGGLALAACSGDGGSDVADEAPAAATTSSPDETAATTAPTVPGDDGGADPAEPRATSTTSTTTTTTEPPPPPMPAGVVWTGPDVVLDGMNGVVRSMTVIDDSVWLLASRWNGMFVARSDDAGETWSEVTVAGPPPSNRAVGPDEIIVGPDGRLVIHGSISSRCRLSFDVGQGFVETGLCLRHRPVLWISDDDGASWRVVEPAAMAPPGDVSVDVVDVIATGDGYLAAGTVRGPDWHVRIWSSPDAETWTLDREIRAPGSFLSADDLVFDGETLVLAASEHPCSNPNDNTSGGWILGAAWADHVRLFVGTGPADLALATPVDHPLARDPLPIADCDAFISSVIAGTDDYPGARATLVGGSIAVLEVPGVVGADLPEGEDPLSAGTRRYARLDGGEWTAIEVEAVPFRQRPGDVPIDADGRMALLELANAGRALGEVRYLAPADGTDLDVIVSDPLLLLDRPQAGTVVDGAVVVAGTSRQDPFDDSLPPVGVFEPKLSRIEVWRSVETAVEDAGCRLAAGASCPFVDLSTVDGYPDFAGADLIGVDLAFADLGEADLTGATLTGARLWGVDGSSADLSGADLSGARLDEARLGVADGADFSGATMRRTSVDDADELLVITDLTGAVLDGTSFDGSDLSRVGPDVDLRDVDVWEDSICPDGLPPDDGPIGTCVRP